MRTDPIRPTLRLRSKLPSPAKPSAHAARAHALRRAGTPLFRRWALVAVFVAALAWAMAPSAAAEGGFDWGSLEILDQGQVEVSSSSGVSTVRIAGAWHVVYCKDGQVMRIRQQNGMWGSPEPVSTTTTARNPHAASKSNELFVVWEDSRTGIPEVWIRATSGSTWSEELCLTEDNTPSRKPVIASDGYSVVVAWEEDADASQIWRRDYYSGGWMASEQVSHSTGAAMDPSIGVWVEWGDYSIAWADTRHGAAEIYRNLQSGEERLTDLPGECGHPSIILQTSGGDAFEVTERVVFEHTGPGEVSEVWSVCSQWWVPLGPPERLSPDDGIPSVSPSIAGYGVFDNSCGYPFPWLEPRSLSVWTDLGALDDHWVSYADWHCPSESDERQLLSDAGLVHAVVGAAKDGYPEDVHAIVLSIEFPGGVQSLVARRGDGIGCRIPGIAECPPLLLAPEGLPADTLLLVETCSGAAMPNAHLRLEFSGELDAALTWDPTQEHPTLTRTTDENGEAVFVLRGGGCSTEGYAYVDCGGIVELCSWDGARSPDRNGDCFVGPDDLAAIEAAIGTDDFCADLDGSGLVDEADVAIVLMTLGDHCSHLTDVPDVDPGEGTGEGSATAGILRVSPNPCRGHTRISLSGAPSSMQLRIFDIGGRLVRDLGTVHETGARAGVEWDARDDTGRRVPSGVYVAMASGPATEVRGTVLVLH